MGVLVSVSLVPQSAAEYAGIAMRCDGAIGGNLADDSGVGLLRMSSAECHGAKCTHGNGQHEYRREANSAFCRRKNQPARLAGLTLGNNPWVDIPCLLLPAVFLS